MGWNRNDDCGNDCAITGCEGARAGEGGVTRTILGGEVVPFCAQLSAHKSSASAIFVVSVCRSAALQQSMSIMPPMLHSLSPKCSGTPANAPAASTSKRSRDVSCFRKVTVTLLITCKFCQAFGRPPHVRPRRSRPCWAMSMPLEVNGLRCKFALLHNCSSKESPGPRIIPQQLVWQ